MATSSLTKDDFDSLVKYKNSGTSVKLVKNDTTDDAPVRPKVNRVPFGKLPPLPEAQLYLPTFEPIKNTPATSRHWDFKFALGLVLLLIAVNWGLAALLNKDKKPAPATAATTQAPAASPFATAPSQPKSVEKPAVPPLAPVTPQAQLAPAKPAIVAPVLTPKQSVEKPVVVEKPQKPKAYIVPSLMSILSKE